MTRRPPGMTLEQAFKWFMPEDPPNDDSVWQWRGPMNKNGYGQITAEGLTMLAHRVSWLVYYGSIEPWTLVVRHKNDTPIDVNPLNLELGTHKDNTNDIYERGRRKRAVPYVHKGPPNLLGVNNGRSVLTESQVLEMRALWEAGNMSKSDLARKFFVSSTMVRYILERRYWNHI